MIFGSLFGGACASFRGGSLQPGKKCSAGEISPAVGRLGGDDAQDGTEMEALRLAPAAAGATFSPNSERPNVL